MLLGGPKDTITYLWTKGLKALVPPNSFGPPTMVAAVFDFKDRGGNTDQSGSIYFRKLGGVLRKIRRKQEEYKVWKSAKVTD